jgi:hypothetical protein
MFISSWLRPEIPESRALTISPRTRGEGGTPPKNRKRESEESTIYYMEFLIFNPSSLITI